MLNVASIWRVAVLMIPLAVMAGCDWIPVRRRVDPALYPIPNRPDPDLIRGRRAVLTPASVKASGTGKASDPATETAYDRQRPPLPELVRVAPEEILKPTVPTPRLDAALARAEATQPVRFEESDEQAGDDTTTEIPLVGPTLPLEIDLEVVPDPVGVAEAVPTSTEDADPLPSDSVDLPPIPGHTSSHQDLARDVDAPSPSHLDASEPSSDESETAEGDAGTEHDSAIPPLLDEDFPTDPEDRELAPEIETRPGTEPLPMDVGPWTLEGQTDEAARWQVMMELLAGAGGEQSDPSEAPGPSLRITRTEFCREILGFDRIEPIAPRSIEAGERTLVYCEVEGVDYHLQGDAFTSRLETILEIVPGAPTEAVGSVLWREFVTFEDRCSRPRHDYFVGYLLTIPSTVAPGAHLLRVTQRDPRSGVEAVADLPFEVVAPASTSASRFQ